MKLYLIGLGVNSKDISFSAFETIKSVKKVVLRTDRTPSADFLREAGIDYTTLDFVYEKSRNFDTLSKNLAKQVNEYLSEGDVCYLVDGAVSEDASCGILKSKHKDIMIFEGVSKVNHYLSMAKLSPYSYSSFSAYDLENITGEVLPMVIFDIDSRELMSELKLKLMDKIGDEQKVKLFVNDKEYVLPIFELDRLDDYGFSSTVVIENSSLESKERFNYNDLFNLVKRLRAKDGCPWDRVQTKESIRKNLIEECYELVDAIDSDDSSKMLEEIGDVLLQAVFHTLMCEEQGEFTSNDVFTVECKKLIFRHSHIFGKDKVSNAEGALDVWDKNKQVEKGFEDAFAYVNDVPHCFPSLLRAKKVLKRIYKNIESVKGADILTIDKLSKSFADGNHCVAGELLLAVVDLLAKCDLDSEEQLFFATDKLIQKFKHDGKALDIYQYLNTIK